MLHTDPGINGGPVASEFFVSDLEKHPGGGDPPPRAMVQALERYEGVITTKIAELAGYC